MKPTRALILLAAALLVPALGGCSKSEPDVSVENRMPDTVETAAPTVEPTPVRTAPPPPVTADTGIDANASDEATADAPTPPDEQMLDDASATGMTARASRGDPADAPATDPASDGVEQK